MAESQTPAATRSQKASSGQLIFDGDCAICTRCADFARARLATEYEVKPWQRLDLSEFALSVDDVTTAVYWVDDKGTNHRGHTGVAKTAIAMGGIYGLVGRVLLVPPFSWIASVVYKVIAKNRDKIPGGTAECKLDP